jgi:hypothetical protein
MVKVTHSGFAGDVKHATDHGEGWKRVLGCLRRRFQPHLDVALSKSEVSIVRSP